MSISGPNSLKPETIKTQELTPSVQKGEFPSLKDKESLPKKNSLFHPSIFQKKAPISLIEMPKAPIEDKALSLENEQDHERLKKTIKTIPKDLLSSFKESISNLSDEAMQNPSIMGNMQPNQMRSPEPATDVQKALPISKALLDLFEAMVGCVIIRNMASQEGLAGTVTEVLLNSKEYENSPFFGLKIIISQYTTASGNYNIELQGSDAQNSVLVSQVNLFMNALNNPKMKLPFRINRIDISLKKDEDIEKNYRPVQGI